MGGGGNRNNPVPENPNINADVDCMMVLYTLPVHVMTRRRKGHQFPIFHEAKGTFPFIFVGWDHTHTLCLCFHELRCKAWLH